MPAPAIIGVGLLIAGAAAIAMGGSKSETKDEVTPPKDEPTKELTDETVEFFRKVAVKEIDAISSELGGMSDPKPSTSLLANMRNNALKSTNGDELREDAKILIGYKFEKAAVAFAALGNAVEGKPVVVAGWGSTRRSSRRPLMLSSTRGR